MLRRKLIINLAPLVVLLLATAIAAVLMLQRVLDRMQHVNSQAWSAVENVNELSVRVNSVEARLYELQTGREQHLDPVILEAESLRTLVDQIGESYVVHQGQAAPIYQRLRDTLPQFLGDVGTLATTADGQMLQHHTEAALTTAVALRQDTLPLSRLVREHARGEQLELSNYFRRLVLGLSLVFLLLLNVSVLVLVRLGAMILQPVDKLVLATRELAAERFDHRVDVDDTDEFGELARAYNDLARRLQDNEKKRIEVLSHVAAAMNHDLNNAINIIELQMRLLSRRSSGDAAQEKCLLAIQNGLQRMTRTVQLLANVRRIVLTEYVPGMQMLDLEKSAQEDPLPPVISQRLENNSV